MTTLKLRLPALTAIAAALAAPAFAADITVVGWGGTWDQAYKEGVWDVYETETGNDIIMEEWAGELAKVRAQVQSGNITYDLVAAESPSVEIGCAEGLFVSLSEETTGPKDSYLPGTLHECGVASDTWATILAYDKDAVGGLEPTTWVDYFDVAKIPGKRGMLAQAQYTLENALMGDGVAPGEVYEVLSTPEGVDRAFAKLESIRDNIVWWSTTTQAVQNLSSGEVVMTDQYNARITNEIQNEGKNWDIVWEAGFFYGTDMWAVVAGAPNEAAAIELVKWFSEPEHQAGFSKLYSYGTGRKEAAEFIPAEQLENLPSSPQHAQFGAEYDSDFWVENKESLEARFKAWLGQ